MHEIVLETKLVGSIEGKFYVPSYQRGYRWGEDEVIRLLDDVYSNGPENYCLQPIVVRNHGEIFELIDGQQRLTTIYLIYKYMNEVSMGFMDEPHFTLSYETRKKSEEFLRTLDMDRKSENIDFWFICNAYRTIEEWFQRKKPLKSTITNINKYFDENVKIIWYEVSDAEDPIALFTRLNIGKIPLTSAELVKAMFLSREGKGSFNSKTQEEISLQWDNMEKELHNDALWYFLTNKSNSGYQTRIDLILNLVTKKSESEKEKYYTYFEMERMRKDSSLDAIWRKILQSFLILKDWFENHELYHKIGYLIAADAMSLLDIFVLAEGRTKDSFKSCLDDQIRKSIEISGNYGELSYEKVSDYKNISRLLLLFNVESVRRNGEQTQWFPFNKYKYDMNGKVSWSLEHIHAQQSEGLNKQSVWKEWLRLHIPSVKSVGGSSELLDTMEAKIESPVLERVEFESIQEQVVSLLSANVSTEYIHSIANLALLTSTDNAALNNSTFDVKRNEIINMDKKGQYIPFCTKMVFLKYYSPSEDIQIHFWGDADRIAYIGAMNEVLAGYLQEPIILEGEK